MRLWRHAWFEFRRLRSTRPHIQQRDQPVVMPGRQGRAVRAEGQGLECAGSVELGKQPARRGLDDAEVVTIGERDALSVGMECNLYPEAVPLRVRYLYLAQEG